MSRKSVGKRKYKKGKRVTRSRHGRSPNSESPVDYKKLFDTYCDMRNTCRKGGTKNDQSHHFKNDLEKFISNKTNVFFEKHPSINKNDMTDADIEALDKYLTTTIKKKYTDTNLSKTESKLLKERIHKI